MVGRAELALATKTMQRACESVLSYVGVNLQIWCYFWHFPQCAIQEGAPWELDDLQGKHKMLFAGSSCCFESIMDVVEHNERLMKLVGLVN
jgi:hypothetical protein